MSILIKGMEMPKDGDFIVIRSDGKAYYVSANPQNAYEGEILLIPPHGDLIDTRDVNLEDGPYEYQDWVEWAWEQYLNAPIFLPADPSKEEEND